MQQGGPFFQLGAAMSPMSTPMQPQAPAAPAQAQDPQSAYLMAALQAMGGKPQGSSQGLAENLLASAMDQYNLKRRAQQLQQQGQQGQSANDAFGAMQGQNAGFNSDAYNLPTIPGS